MRFRRVLADNYTATGITMPVLVLTWHPNEHSYSIVYWTWLWNSAPHWISHSGDIHFSNYCKLKIKAGPPFFTYLHNLVVFIENIIVIIFTCPNFTVAVYVFPITPSFIWSMLSFSSFTIIFLTIIFSFSCRVRTILYFFWTPC